MGHEAAKFRKKQNTEPGNLRAGNTSGSGNDNPGPVQMGEHRQGLIQLGPVNSGRPEQVRESLILGAHISGS